MSANVIHNLVLRYVPWQVEDATARLDNYARQLCNVSSEFNEQGEETLSAEENRASIESNMRQIEECLLRATRYRELPPGNLATTVCPACFIHHGVQGTSLEYVNGSEVMIHCVVCRSIIE